MYNTNHVRKNAAVHFAWIFLSLFVCAAVEQLLYFSFFVIKSKAKKQLPFSLA